MCTATCSVGGSSSCGLHQAHPPNVLESCFGWGSVWSYRLTPEEVVQRQAELEKQYPGYNVSVSSMGEYVLLRRR